MIARRKLLLFAGAAALVAPLACFSQQKVPRIGFLYFGSQQSALETGRYEAFLQGMRELGYVEGNHFVMVARFADGGVDNLPALAAELVAGKVDVIVSSSAPANDALRKVTSTIAVVVTAAIDPVRSGYANSLARPGGNITGMSIQQPELAPKHIELLMLAAPKLSRLAVLWNPDNSGHPATLENTAKAARQKQIQVTHVAARTPAEIESGLVRAGHEHATAIMIFGDGLFAQQFRQIASLAIKLRLISLYQSREFAELGGFMSYGGSIRDNNRRAASFVDKILKVAKPGDLPFEQSTRFELVLNAKTAKAIGVPVPPELLLRADEVIE